MTDEELRQRKMHRVKEYMGHNLKADSFEVEYILETNWFNVFTVNNTSDLDDVVRLKKNLKTYFNIQYVQFFNRRPHSITIIK
jgi:hypothetical protein